MLDEPGDGVREQGDEAILSADAKTSEETVMAKVTVLARQAAEAAPDAGAAIIGQGSSIVYRRRVGFISYSVARIMSERIRKSPSRLRFTSSDGRVDSRRSDRHQWSSAALGDSAAATNVLTVDSRRIGFAAASACRVLICKPEARSARSIGGRPSIFERLPALNGLLGGRRTARSQYQRPHLLTTDGDLANRLMHPSSNVERRYLVRVMGEVTTEQLEHLRKGVELEDGPASFNRVYEVGGRGVNRWYGVVLREGRKREVRRLWEALGLKVSRLKRIRFGPISLPAQLRRGQFMELDGETIAALRQLTRTAGQSQSQTQSRPQAPVQTPRPTEQVARRSSPPRALSQTSSRASSHAPRRFASARVRLHARSRDRSGDGRRGGKTAPRAGAPERIRGFPVPGFASDERRAAQPPASDPALRCARRWTSLFYGLMLRHVQAPASLYRFALYACPSP